MTYTDDANEDEIRNIVQGFAGGGRTLNQLYAEKVNAGTDASTGKITQSKEQFLEKYKDALDANGNFIPGKANLWFDGENAAALYDNLIGSKTVQVPHGNWREGGTRDVTYFNPELNLDWIEDTRSAGGWGQVKDVVLPAAAVTAAVLAGQYYALPGAGGTAAAATGAPASGVAGSLGLTKGIGATALNSGVNSALINGGMQLATTGQLDIGKALTAGITSGVTGGLGDWASSTLTDYLPEDWSQNTINALGAGTEGAVVSGLTGKDPLTGALGAGLGSYAGDTAADLLGKGQYTGNIAGAVNAGVNTAVKGGDIGKVLSAAGAQLAATELAAKVPGYSSAPAEVQKAIRAGLASSIQGKNPTAAVLNSALSSVMNYSQGVLFPKKTGSTGSSASATPANSPADTLSDAGVAEASAEDLEQLAVGLPFLDGQTDFPTVYTFGDGRTDVDIDPLIDEDLAFLDMPGYYAPPDLGTVNITGQRETPMDDIAPPTEFDQVVTTGKREDTPPALDQVTVTGPRDGLTEVIDPADLIPPPMPPIPPINTTPTAPGGKAPSITLPTGTSTPSSSSGGTGATMYTAPVEGAKIRLMDFDNYSIDDIADIINGGKQQKQPAAQTLFAAEGGSIDDLLAYLRS